jgi:hypothetical protein
MKNNQSAFDAKIQVQIWCRRLNQTAANLKIVQPFSRVLSLSGRQTVEGLELSKDMQLKFKLDKIDISYAGFIRDPAFKNQSNLTFLSTQFFTSIVRETFKTRNRQGFNLPYVPQLFQWSFQTSELSHQPGLLQLLINPTFERIDPFAYLADYLAD